MNQKRNYLLLIATILMVGIPLLSSTPPSIADVTIPPITISTLDYLEYEYVLIPSTSEVNLTYISSDYQSSAISIQKTQYYPVENETKYKITSTSITPDYTFTATPKNFVFQDETTGQLYTVIIDYTEIMVPDSPEYTQLMALQIQHQNLLSNYSLLQNTSMNYTSLINTVNMTLTAFNNSTALSIQNKTKALYNAYKHFFSEYTSYYDNYVALTDDYATLTTSKNLLETQLHNISDLYHLLNMSNCNLTQQLNLTKKELNQTRLNMSYYEQFIRDIGQGIKTQAYLSYGDYTGYYRTPGSYEKELKDLQNAVGITPILIIFTIIITVLIFVMIYFLILRNTTPSNAELESIGYNQELREHNYTIIKSLKNAGKKIKDTIIPNTETISDNHVDKTGPYISDYNPSSAKPEIDEKLLDKIRIETDQKIQPIQKDVEQLKEETHTIDDKVDQILHIVGKKERRQKTKPKPIPA